jgi:ABC-type dipeptide/oligopeptide/nickel transport system permease subunit
VREEARLRRHITSAVWAAVITVLSAIPAGALPPVLPSALHWLYRLWEIVPMLALYTLSIAGRTGGPEGLPPIPEIILLTFVLWWVIVELVRALWRRLRARHAIRPA